MYGQHVVEQLDGVVGDRRDRAQRAGVAEDHVDGAPAFDGALHDAFDVVGLLHVGDHRRHDLGVEGGRHGAHRRLGDVDQRDPGTVLDEQPRGRGADAPARAGQHADLSRERSRHRQEESFVRPICSTIGANIGARKGTILFVLPR